LRALETVAAVTSTIRNTARLFIERIPMPPETLECCGSYPQRFSVWEVKCALYCGQLWPTGHSGELEMGIPAVRSLWRMIF
jgi:hypothetical protein